MAAGLPSQRQIESNMTNQWHVGTWRRNGFGILMLSAVNTCARLLREATYPLYSTGRVFSDRIRYRKSSYIAESWDGHDSCLNPGKAAIYVHFDRTGRVHEYVFHAVRSLKDLGFRVYFVSNAPNLAASARKQLLPLCARVLRRRNVGHDFGAYRDVLLDILPLQLETVLLMNDSVYGPLSPLDKVLQDAKPEKADVWGLTDSWDMRYHLQTYFILFHAQALQNDSFVRYWQELPYVNHREWVVKFGEVGLTQKLLRGGLRCRALFPYEELTRKFLGGARTCEQAAPLSHAHLSFSAHMAEAIEGGGPLNPTHHFWDLLIQELGFPFVKRDLLQRNPIRVPTVARWREIVARNGFDVELITDHLRMLARHHSV